MAPQLGQTASEFRLKDRREDTGEEHQKTEEEPADHEQVQQWRDESEGEENNRQPREHFGTARATKVKIAIVNTDAEQNDLNNAAPAFEPELEKFLHHGSSASAARNAATFSLTSWTRIMSAPRPRNVAVSGVVGVRRSLMSDEPINFSGTDLRESPTTSGLSCARSRSRFLSSAKLCSSVIPKTIRE